MKELIEIVGILTRTKMLEPEKIQYQESDKCGKRLLSGVLAKKWKSDDEAALELYSASSEDERYYKCKRRLKSALLQLLFQVKYPTKGGITRKQARHDCSIRLAQAEILQMNAASYAAAELLEKVFQDAAHFQLSQFAFRSAEKLENLFRQFGEKEKYEFYRSETDKWQSIVADEILANRLFKYFDEVGMATSLPTPEQKTKLPHILDSLQQLAEKTITQTVLMQNYRAQLYAQMFGNNYDTAIVLTYQTIRIFDRFQHLLTPMVQSEFDYQLFCCYLQIRQYDKARHHLDASQREIPEGTSHWLLGQRGVALLGLHTGKYNSSADAIEKLIRYKFGNQRKDAYLQEEITLLHGYLTYAIQATRTPMTPAMEVVVKSFDVYGFMQNTPIFTKDKTGGNVLRIILQVLLMLMELNIEGLLIKSESLRQYRQIYLKDPLFRRASAMLKVFQILIDNNCDVAVTTRKAVIYLKILKPTPDNNNDTIEGFEPIPWDQLWSIVTQHIAHLKSTNALHF